MLQFFKRWLPSPNKASKASGDVLDTLRDWAERRELALRPVRDDGGAVIEGRTGTTTWRLEWGPAQRAYVDGYELRLRAELDFGNDLQLLVMNRLLQEAMERAVFDQYVEGVQTRIDDETPPEMRWLVMFPKPTSQELGSLREGFHAVGNNKPWLLQWLEGPLGAALGGLGLPPEHPLVLMIGRGRLLLRTQYSLADDARLDACFKLFECALREARRVGLQAAPQAPSTHPSLWSSSALPNDEPRS